MKHIHFQTQYRNKSPYPIPTQLPHWDYSHLSLVFRAEFLRRFQVRRFCRPIFFWNLEKFSCEFRESLLYLSTASKAAAPLRSVPDEAAVGDVFAFFIRSSGHHPSSLAGKTKFTRHQL